jgi:hypothetical protein
MLPSNSYTKLPLVFKQKNPSLLHYLQCNPLRGRVLNTLSLVFKQENSFFNSLVTLPNSYTLQKNGFLDEESQKCDQLILLVPGAGVEPARWVTTEGF